VHQPRADDLDVLSRPNFDDVRDGKAYMQSPAFAKNPIGVPFEPESFVSRLKAGASAEELVRIE
jgi:hypothetical protein